MPVLKHILAATDLSPAAERAVLCAAALAKRWEATLYIVHARPDWNLFARWRPPSAEAYEEIACGADSLLMESQTRVKADFGLQPRLDARLGRASDVIAAMAAERAPHLVVIGAHGEHASGEATSPLGGTALKLLRRVEQPLLIVRNSAPDEYRTSLVAVDAPSPLARRAVLWGSGLARTGTCYIVHAYGIAYVERMRRRETEALMKQAAEGAARDLNELTGAGERGTRAQLRVVSGEPVSAILAEIEAHAAQLLVVGKRNLPVSHIPPGALGTVAFRMADRAPIDVLILS